MYIFECWNIKGGRDNVDVIEVLFEIDILFCIVIRTIE